GWRIVVLFSNREFQSRMIWIYLIGAIFAAVGLGLTLLLNLSMTQWIVKPFKQMVQVMKKVQRGDIQTRLPVNGNDEISQVGSALNSMLEQLNQMIDREYKAVLGKRDAEYRALQSQIRPHFLYNTLNGFVGLNRSGQHRLLEKAIMSLSGMMRYTLEHQEMSTLQEEMKFLNQYCELQQLRFQDRLTSAVRYDPELAEVRLPKLLLQPHVENAIVHGIEPVARTCEIEIDADVVEAEEPSASNILRIRIKDNGKGFDPSLTEEGVGTRNVRERLQLYSKDAGLIIESRLGEGTTAEFRIPLREVEVR
ncbi:MAG: sensor histidine kinase, partial [Cohnella sp.]|nr:sensor histidine kinase [Cohnella sp.]